MQGHCNDYRTLDDAEEFSRAKSDPKAYIEALKGKLSAIDECQLVPPLFPALKVRVGTKQVPGQFILTGSVRFSSREAIKESLTGRLMNLELYPLVLTELENLPNSSALITLMETASLASALTGLKLPQALYRKYNQSIETYFTHGGLPKVCFTRDIKVRKTLLKDIVETILDRDVRLVYRTTVAFEQIRDLCRQFAKNPQEPVNYQNIQRETGLAPLTTKKLMRALESVFFIRRMPLIGDYKGECVCFEDQMERDFFQPGNPSDAGSMDWVHLFYRNARAQFGYRLGYFPDYSQYKTRGGALVPLVIRLEEKRLGIFVLKDQTELTRSVQLSAESFLKKYEHARVVFLLRDGNQYETLSERMAVLPLCAALF